MRTTIDLPDEVFKKAKIKAIESGMTLKELFLHALEKELDIVHPDDIAPWKSLKSMGSTKNLQASTSGFEGYAGPDWNQSIQVNDDPNNDPA